MLALLLGHGTQNQTTFVISAVQVTGHQRYSVAHVQMLSGLSAGQPVTIADLDATMQRMADTGLFAKVGYRYAPDPADRSRLIVTYEIEEPEWKMPVVFDNFPWFDDEELQRLVAAVIPTFDGTLPLADGAQALMTRTLRSLLKARGLDRDVTFVPHTNLATKQMRFVFKVTDPDLRVCAVSFDGASRIWRDQFAPAVADRIGQDYSRASFEAFLDGEVRESYRNRGFLASVVGRPVARLDGGCQGVTITVPIAEGEEYRWARITWKGHAALAERDLEKMLGVRSGSVADTSVLAAGLKAIQNAYGSRGHVFARLSHTITGDPATAGAHLTVTIDEGAQFRMGSLQLVGFTDKDAQDLQKRWRLKSGEVFDATYPTEFWRTQIVPLMRNRRMPAPTASVTADRQALTVTVKFAIS